MTEDVLFAQEGHLGLITLNRPDALNALTLPMIFALQKQLGLWKEDKNIHAVVLRAVPGYAFCAGGDVRSLYAHRLHHEKQMQFFEHEYRLNHFIHCLKKPYISFIDGAVMGGGVGISLHGSHPVASDRFIFAMPETGIGFFPDIGASYLLTRCPGALGIYLGLTGDRLGPQEAMQAGLVTQIVSSEKMHTLFDALINEDLSKDAYARVDQCLRDHALSYSEVDTSKRFLIDACFSQATVERIRLSLQQAEDIWAQEIDKILAKKSPMSLKVTLLQFQRAKGLTLAQCLKMDYDLARCFMEGSDFYEGVRALLIDKDKNPQWNPAKLDLVSENKVFDYFFSDA